MTQTPDQDRDFASEFRQLVDQADAADPQAFDPMAPADPVPLAAPGVSETAKSLESEGLFDDLAKQNKVEREAETERGMFGSFFDAAVNKAKSIFSMDDADRQAIRDRFLPTVTGPIEVMRTVRQDAPLGESEKGFVRGVINRRGSAMGGMAQIAGDLGASGASQSLDERSKTLFDVSQSDLFKAKVETLGKIKSEAWFSDTMDYVSSKFGEGVGSSVESFVMGLSPMGLPGALGYGYTGSIGEIRQELQEAGVTEPGQIAKYSYLAAIPHAMLDQFTEVGVLTGLSQQAKKEVTKGIVRTMLKTGTAEGVTEATQRVIEIGAVAHALGGDSPNTAVLAALSADLEKGIDSTILESGVAGFIPGLGFGAAEVAGQKAMPEPTEVPKEVQEARAKTGTATDASPAPAEAPAIPAGKRTRTIDLDGFTPAQLQNDREVPGPDIQVGPDGQVAPRIVRPYDAPEFDATEFNDDLVTNNKPIPEDMPDDDLSEAIMDAQEGFTTYNDRVRQAKVNPRLRNGNPDEQRLYAEQKAKRDELIKSRDRYESLVNEYNAIRTAREETEAAQPNFIGQIAGAVSDPAAAPVIEQAAQVAEQVSSDPETAAVVDQIVEAIAPEMSDSAYKRLVSVLAGKTTRTGWAKATKVSEKTLASLLDRAEKDGLVRRDAAGNFRRGKDIKAAIKALRKGSAAPAAPARTPAPATATASPLPAARLTIPADMRVEKAIASRERKLRRPLPPYLTGHARDIARVLGTPEMDAVIERLKSDEMIRKAEMHEIAALVGKKVPKSATKKAALQTILDRHNDAMAARVGAVLEQEPEANADSTAVLEDAGAILEDGISQLLQEIGAIGPVGEPSGGNRAGSGSDVGGDVLPGTGEGPGGNVGADGVPGEPAAGLAGDGAARPDTGPAEVLTDDQKAAVAAKVAADKEAADQKRRDRETLNYQITEDDKIGQGGPKAKIRANIEAIKVLRTLEDEGRGPTEAEKKILVKYTGWGAFSQKMFEEYDAEFQKERDQFRSLVSKDEYEAARKSTRNAHYTSPDVVNAMWDALQYLGFKGGRAIEPGAGSGNFIGLTPSNLREATEWTAVELDPLTGGIAKNLYQAADVRIQGYQDAKFPDSFFDLAISNVPFDSAKVYDPVYKGKFNLHDFYFVKSIDKVRPGGLVAFITSAGTMDKKSAAARREIAKRADLVGAIRLPGGSKGAFKGNAGTDVTTDIIFLRKRLEGEPVGDQTWLNVEEIKTPEGPTTINSYFAQNPDMMLGKMRLIGSMYGKNEPVLIGPSENLDQKIAEAVRAGMPENVMTERGTTAIDLRNVDTETDGIKDGAYYVKGKDLYRKVAGVGEPQSVPKAQREKIEMFLGLRDIVNEMLAIQGGLTEARPERMAQLRDGLNEAYDAFVAAHGPINKTVVTKQNRKDGKEITIKRFPNLSAFEDDPDAFKVSAIEVYDEKTDTAKKAAIFTQDVVSAYVPPDVQSPADALAVSLNEKGGVDIPLIASRLGLTEAEAIAALGEQVFLDPVGETYRTASEYLAGDVVGKLETARTAAETNPAYGRNVAALEAVQPEPLTRADIRVPFGAPYIPVEIYEQYLTEVLKAQRIKLRYDDVMARWYLVEGSFPPEIQVQFGTSRRKVSDLVEAALNSATISITYKDDEGKTIREPEAEAEARAKVDIIKDTFSGDPEQGIEGWLWSDYARATRIEAAYNNQFNRIVQEKHDGSHLTFPGLARVVTGADGSTFTIDLKPHRVNAIWKVIKQGNALFNHAVGSGKTWTSIMASMEMKRLGMIQRPMFVVPNHMLNQFSTEFYQAYPNAKLLIATKDQMNAKNRKKFAARIAADTWDGIIITHSSFGKLGLSKQAYQDYYREQIEELEAAMLQAQDAGDEAAVSDMMRKWRKFNEQAGGDPNADPEGLTMTGKKKRTPTVKQKEEKKDKAREKLKKLVAEEDKDDGVVFEETGIDFLFVDEAHLFKSLPFQTMHTRIKGIGGGSSKRAVDLFLKMRHLEKSRPGRSAVFMTGTPVSNTMAELYTMQRYLQGPTLKKFGIDKFDAWAGTFGNIVTKSELSSNSRDYKDTESFSEFVNMPELMTIAGSMMDTQTAEMLKLPRPELKGGKLDVVQAELSPEEGQAIDDLIKKMETREKDEPFLPLFTAGIQLATDMRLVDPTAPFNPNGKIAKAVDNIFNIWEEGNADPDAPNKGQLVFLDMGVPGSKGKAKSSAMAADVETAQDDATAAIDLIRKELAEEAGQVDEGEEVEVDEDQVEVEALLRGKFNLYQDIKDRLIAKGVPREQIAFIHDAKNDDQKAKMFEKMRSGEIRVMIGSTGKMGVGTNVQKLLYAMHHLDAPWRPADLEQRDGRILRQGNKNKEVRIFRYITVKSFDAYRWQLLDRKSQFIGQLYAGAAGVRHMEDITPPLPEAAELKAAATGNPLIIERAELEREVKKLEVAERTHYQSQKSAAQSAKALQDKVASLQTFNAQYEQDAPRVEDLKGEAFKVTLETSGKRTVTDDRKKAGEFVKRYLLGAGQQWYKTTVDLGEMSSFAIKAEVKKVLNGVEVLPIAEGAATYQTNEPFVIGEDADPGQVIQRWVRLVSSIPAYSSRITAQIAEAENTIPKMQEAAQPKPFPQTEKLVEKRKRLDEVIKALSAPKPEADPAIAQGPPTNEPITLIFGGSFNPIHAGHEAAIRNAAKFMESKGYTVARTIIAPSPDKLLKAKLGDRAYSLDDRAELIRRQFGNDPAFPVETGPSLEVEAMTEKPKRTQLAQWAQANYPDATVVNVTGADAAPGSPPMYPSVYQGDPGTSHEGYFYLAMPRDEGDGMSSSTIRKALSEGKPVPAGMMTPEAEAYLMDMIAARPELVAPAAPAPAPAELDPDAPNFGLPPPPRTLPDDHPLLVPHWDDDPAKQDTSPEREAMRAQLIEDRFAGKAPAMPGQQIAYVMGGGGASGKGTLLKRLKKAGIIDEDYVELDPDSFKTGDPEKGWGGIPEFWQIDAEGDSRAAAVTHEESSMLNKRAVKRGVDGGYNLVLDQTMGTPDKGRKVLQMLKDAGYEVRLFGVTVAPETAVQRAVDRAKGPERRYVPLDHLLAAHKGFSEGFESYAEMADYAALVDTDVSYGEEYLFVAEKKPGEPLAILGEEAYIEFGRKADLNGQEDTLNDLRRTQGEVREKRETRSLAPPFVARELAGSLGRAKGGRPQTGPEDGSSVSGQRLTPPKDSDPVAWLRDIFMRYGVDPEAYGQGQASSLAKAVKEIQDGEIQLIVRDGKLVRQGTVAAIEVVADLPGGARMRLVEDRQEMTDGRVRRRDLPQSLAEKMLPGENPEQVIKRALSEELGVTSFKMLGSVTTEPAKPFESPRYPGLLSEYIGKKATVVLDAAEFKPEYKEVQKEKTNYYSWRYAGATPAEGNVMMSLAPSPVQDWFNYTRDLKAQTIPPRVILGEFRVETKPGNGTLTYTVHQGAPRVDEESGYDESQIGKFYLRTDAAPDGFAVSVQNMIVDEDYRVRGIATAVFDMIEADIAATGVRLLPPPVETLSADGRAFWEARDPEALANRERMDRDIYFGDDVAPRIGVNAPGVVTTPFMDAKREEFEAALLKVIARLPKPVQAEVQSRIQIGKYELNGYYDSGRKLIKVALSGGLDNALTTIRHEEIHALRDLGLITDAEWKLLTEAANKARVRADIGLEQLEAYRQNYAAKVAKEMLTRRGFADLVKLPWADVEVKLVEMFGFDPENRVESLKSLNLWDEAILQDLLDEEAVAVLVSERSGGQSYGTTVDAIIDRIAQFIERLKNALRGIGFQTVEDVFRAIDEGTIGKRDPQFDGMGGTFVPKGMMYAIRAFHGSPHSFRKFDLSKIGTGEGNQSFGVGLYFAESEAVARRYRDNLSAGDASRVVVDGAELPESFTRSLIVRHRGNLTKSADEAQANLARAKELGLSDLASDAEKALNEITGLNGRSVELPDAGRMYEVSVAADREDFLDWDVPLSKQSPKVRAGIERVLARPEYSELAWDIKNYGADTDKLTGQVLHNMLTMPGGYDPDKKTNVAQVLREAGIAGIQYLDGMSRKVGEGSRNYVVFDDGMIEITAIDGTPVEAEEAAEIVAAAQQAEQQPNGLFDTAMFSMATGEDPASPIPQPYVDALNERIGGLGKAPETSPAALSDTILMSLAKWGNYQPLGIGTNPQYPNTATEAPEKGLSDVVADTVKALGLEGMARQGRLDPAMKRAARKMGGEMMGQTNRATGVVRLALKNDMATLAHEGGHALELRASVRDDLNAIKAQFAEDLTVPPAPNAPVPVFPQTGFSGVELDQDSIRLAIDSVDAERQMRVLAAELGVLKSRARSRQEEARLQQIQGMYEQFQTVAGGNRETLVRRFGNDRADAVLTDLMPVDRATAPTYAATRFSKSGQPAPRVVIPPTDVELSEGFAEWFRIYLTNPKQAKALSRGFYEAFEDVLDATEPEMLTRFQMVQEGVDALAKAAPVSAVRARVQSTVQPGLIESIRLGLSEAAEAGRIAAQTAKRTGSRNQVAAMISGFSGEIWRPMSDRLYGFYHAAFDARHPMKKAVQFLIDKAVENSGITLGKAERAVVKALHDPYKLWRLAEHSKTHATAALQFGIVHKGAIDPSGPSYWDALTQAFGGSRRGQWNDEMAEMFGSYLIGRRMLAEFARYDRGELENVPDTIISRDVWQKSVAQLEKDYPQFKRAAQTMYGFQQELLKYKFENGFLTQEQFDEYRQRIDYAPLNRIMDAGTPSMLGAGGNVNKRRLIYRFQGSTRDFINPLETIAQDMFATQQRVEMNRVIAAMDRMARAAGPGGGAIAERIPAKEMKATKIRVADVASLAKPLRGALARTGLDKADRDSLLADAQNELRDTMRLTAMQSGLAIDDQQMLLDTIDLLFDGEASKTIFKATDISEAGEPIVYLWEGGQRIPIRMGDNEIAQDIFEGFQAFGSNDTNPLVDAAALGTQALRAGITKAPSYVLVNYLRDQLSTWVLSENFTPFVTGAKGLKSVLTNDAVGKRYAAFAGLMGGVDANLIDQAAHKHDVLTLRRKGFFAVPAKSGIGQVWQRALKAMEVTEAGTRFGHFDAAFKRAKQDGLTDEEAAFEAAYAAHDVIDFSRRGSRTMEVSRIVAFLNAALQGLDSTRRAFTGERETFTGYRDLITPYVKAANGSPLSVAERKRVPAAAKTFGKMVTLGLIGLALSMLYKDDEEYEEFNDYMRATHWFFKIGDTWYRFPKPFDLAIFSQIFEGAFDRMVKDDPRAGEKFLQSLKHTMVPPHEVNVANLYYEMVTGIDTFRNREIVPMDISKLPPELQFGAYTSEVGRMIGSITGMSPQKVDHVMGGLLGTIGRDIQTVSDAVLPWANEQVGGALPGVSDRPRAEKSLEDIAIISRFTRRAGRGSLSSETFWKQMKMDGGEYVSAAEGYKTLRNTGRGAEARDLLANVSDDQRAYAVLEGDFTEKEQDINPLNRAKQVMSAMSGLRKEMVLGKLYKGGLTPKDAEKKGSEAEEIILPPSKQKIVNEILEDLSMREARNALIVVGLPGWQQKDIMPTEGLMDELAAAAPEVAEELELRLTKGRNKVYPFEGVRKVWGEARDRLLAQGADADLSDLVADAKFP